MLVLMNTVSANTAGLRLPRARAGREELLPLGVTTALRWPPTTSLGCSVPGCCSWLADISAGHILSEDLPLAGSLHRER